MRGRGLSRARARARPTRPLPEPSSRLGGGGGVSGGWSKGGWVGGAKKGGGERVGLERTNIVFPCRVCLWCCRRYLARTMPAGQSWPPQPSVRSSCSLSGMGRRPPKSRVVVVGGLWVGDWTRSSLMARGSDSLSDMVGGVLAGIFEVVVWWMGMVFGVKTYRNIRSLSTQTHHRRFRGT